MMILNEKIDLFHLNCFAYIVRRRSEFKIQQFSPSSIISQSGDRPFKILSKLFCINNFFSSQIFKCGAHNSRAIET
uniref:Ovule protein n=1 Tax=Romanomermis culicivorax TaxID=13658 RepID=A0A915JNQ3_ROMCU